MTKKIRSIVQDISNSYEYMLKLIVTTVILAFGINLISSQFVATVNFSPVTTIILGLILCSAALIYLFYKLLYGSFKKHEFHAFILYDSKENKLVKVPRYDFSEDIQLYFESAFNENLALENQWKKNSLHDFYCFNGNTEEDNKSVKLIVEAAQYYLLKRLSIHLTDYFAHKDLEEHNLKKYGRVDIPEVLLSNKFLDLFSRPMTERSAFIDENDEENESEFEGEVISVYSNGAYYDKFELVLPLKSKLKKPNDTKIEIETQRLKISMETQFDGCNASFPRGFEKYYLGIDDKDFRFKAFEIKIDINVDMKLRSIFSRLGWEYYYWIDSFLNDIDQQVSPEVFFTRINWETALTTIQCQNVKSKNKEDAGTIDQSIDKIEVREIESVE